MATILLLELALDDLLLFLGFLGAENEFGFGGQRLQENIAAIFVGECHAEVQPVVVLAFALDRDERASTCRLPRAKRDSTGRPLRPGRPDE